VVLPYEALSEQGRQLMREIKFCLIDNNATALEMWDTPYRHSAESGCRLTFSADGPVFTLSAFIKQVSPLAYHFSNLLV
jgi:hypothetical protein